MNGLTAWERWELASIDSDIPEPANGGTGDASDAITVDAQELERLREEARREGYEAGYATGKATTQAEAARLATAATSLDQALKDLDQSVADELLALAMEIARQVVRAEISVKPEHIVTIVHEALAQLPHQHTSIFMHPDDASLLRAHAGETLAHAGHRILEDPRLRPGDCLLESGNSQLDATVATRWKRVVESLGLPSAWHDKA